MRRPAESVNSGKTVCGKCPLGDHLWCNHWCGSIPKSGRRLPMCVRAFPNGVAVYVQDAKEPARI